MCNLIILFILSASRNKDVNPLDNYNIPTVLKRLEEKFFDSERLEDLNLSTVNRAKAEELLFVLFFLSCLQQSKPLPESDNLYFRTWIQDPLVPESYKNKMSTLLFVEEMQLSKDIKQFNLEGVTMQVYTDDRSLLVLNVPGLAENRPSLLRHDHVLVSYTSDRGKEDKKKYRGYVHHLLDKQVALGFKKE